MPNPTVEKLHEGIRTAVQNPKDYEVRFNIMWTAT